MVPLPSAGPKGTNNQPLKNKPLQKSTNVVASGQKPRPSSPWLRPLPLLALHRPRLRSQPREATEKKN